MSNCSAAPWGRGSAGVLGRSCTGTDVVCGLRGFRKEVESHRQKLNNQVGIK